MSSECDDGESVIPVTGVKRDRRQPMRYKISPQLNSHRISQLRLVGQGSYRMILLSANPPALPLPVRYKISPVFKCLCWRELSRCWLAMRYKIALQSLLANS
jgi:hypothetical protein